MLFLNWRINPPHGLHFQGGCKGRPGSACRTTWSNYPSPNPNYLPDCNQYSDLGLGTLDSTQFGADGSKVPLFCPDGDEDLSGEQTETTPYTFSVCPSGEAADRLGYRFGPMVATWEA